MVSSLVLVEPAVSTILVKDRKNKAQILSLLLRNPSTALSANKFQSKSLDPSLAAFQRGDLQSALRLNLDGIMNTENALGLFAEPIQTMFKDNAKTIGELSTTLPIFSEEDAQKISAPSLLVHGVNSPKVFRAIAQKLGKVMPSSKVKSV